MALITSRIRGYLVLSLVLVVLFLSACGGDGGETSGSTGPASIRALAVALQEMAAPPVSRDLLPLQEEAAEADLVGSGTLVAVRPGPVFVGTEQVPGFKPELPFLVLEIDVDRVVKGDDLVSSDQPLIVLRPISVSTDADAFRDLAPTPVAFFLDVVSLAELAEEADSTVPDPAPGVDQDSVIAEPTHPAAFLAEENDVGFPLFAPIERTATPEDLIYLESLGLGVDDLEVSDAGS